MRSRILHNIKASGNYWPASEKPSGWHLAGGQIVAHDGMLAGYVSVDAYTVELGWLKLVGTIGVSSTHPYVQAISSLKIFKLVHAYFMSSRTPCFFSTKVAKRM